MPCEKRRPTGGWYRDRLTADQLLLKLPPHLVSPLLPRRPSFWIICDHTLCCTAPRLYILVYPPCFHPSGRILWDPRASQPSTSSTSPSLPPSRRAMIFDRMWGGQMRGLRGIRVNSDDGACSPTPVCLPTLSVLSTVSLPYLPSFRREICKETALRGLVEYHCNIPCNL